MVPPSPVPVLPASTGSRSSGPAGGELAALQKVTQTGPMPGFWRETGNQPDLARLYEQAQQAMAREMWSEAARLLQQILDLDLAYRQAAQLHERATQQSQLHVLYRQGQVALERRDWAEAVERFGKIQAIDATYKDVAQKADQAQNERQQERLYAEASAYLDRGDWSNAMEVLKQIKPDPIQRPALKADLDYAQSRAETGDDRSGDWQQVAEWLKPLVQAGANYPELKRNCSGRSLGWRGLETGHSPE